MGAYGSGRSCHLFLHWTFESIEKKSKNEEKAQDTLAMLLITNTKFVLPCTSHVHLSIILAKLG